MKFLVDELPYDNGYCPFAESTLGCWNYTKCPRRYTREDWEHFYPGETECRLLKERK